MKLSSYQTSKGRKTVAALFLAGLMGIGTLPTQAKSPETTSGLQQQAQKTVTGIVLDDQGDPVIGSLAGGRYLLRPGRYTIMSSGSPNAFFMGAGGKNAATEAPIAAYGRSVVVISIREIEIAGERSKAGGQTASVNAHGVSSCILDRFTRDGKAERFRIA